MCKSIHSAKGRDELPVVREKGNQSWITLFKEYNEDMVQLCGDAISILKHLKNCPI